MGLKPSAGQVVSQAGWLRLYHRADLAAKDLLQAINGGGETLKTSPKSQTRRVGEWVVKRSRMEHGLGPIKRTLVRNRYRRGWLAANFLRTNGVCVPEPLAYGEWTWHGIMFGNVIVTNFLDDYVNVEVYAAEMVKRAASQKELDAFFAGLARGVNRFISTGAYHADLSGKNIFTKDGSEFCFIDLDSVVLGSRGTETHRLKNHVQLYDSFCDFCSHDTLSRFIGWMLPDGKSVNGWLQLVEHGQKARRRLHQEKNPGAGIRNA